MIIISLLIIGASCSMYLPETPRNPGSSTSHPTLFGLCSDSADNIQVCSWNYDGTNQKLLHVLGTSGTIDPSMSAAFFDAKSNIYTTLIYNDTTFEPVSTIIRYDVSNDELLALPTSLDMYDIEVTVNGTAFALADSQTSDVRSIYRIDLDTGEATHVGDFNDYDGFFIGDWVLDSVLGIYYLLYTGADDSAIFLGMDVATGQLVTRYYEPINAAHSRRMTQTYEFGLNQRKRRSSLSLSSNTYAETSCPRGWCWIRLSMIRPAGNSTQWSSTKRSRRFRWSSCRPIHSKSLTSANRFSTLISTGCPGCPRRTTFCIRSGSPTTCRRVW